MKSHEIKALISERQGLQQIVDLIAQATGSFPTGIFINWDTRQYRQNRSIIGIARAALQKGMMSDIRNGRGMTAEGTSVQDSVKAKVSASATVTTAHSRHKDGIHGE